MSDLLGMTLADVVAALRARRAPLPYEMGAFVALQVCESLQSGLAVVRATDVRIADDGAVSVFAAAHSATDADAAQAVVALLAQMLVAAGPGVPPQLLALVERGAPDLRRLRDELEATLVPLNRGASRRVLARLVREAAGAPKVTPSASAPGGALLDDALDDLLGAPPMESGAAPDDGRDELDDLLAQRVSGIPSDKAITKPPPAGTPHAPTHLSGQDPFSTGTYIPASSPPPPSAQPAARRSQSQSPLELSDPFVPVQDEEEPTGRHPSQYPPRPDRTQDVDLDSTSTQLDDDAPLPKPAKLPSFAQASVREQGPAETPRPPAARAQREAPPSGRVSLDGFDDIGVKKGRPLLWLFVVVLLLGGLGGGVAWLRPDVIARLRGATDGVDEAVARQHAEHDRQQAALAAQHAAQFGDLVVRGTPERAQVLMYVGRGPVTVADLPEGVAHEFVAIIEGKAPARAVVPPDAAWETTPEGARFELAVQVPDREMAEADLVLGDTRLPHDVGAGNDTLGTVRVITAPAGAKVYQLIGFTPDVRVSDVRVDSAIELIIWVEGFRLQRRVVGPSDWRVEDGKKVAEITIALEELHPSRHH